MRRSLSVVLLVALLGLVALPSPGSASGAGDGTGTTLEETIIPEGEKDLGFGPGQERVTRTLGWSKTKGTGKPLAGFKQLSDIHVVDEESPARVEYFDGCTETDPGLSSAYRPQEAMSTQVGNAMLERLSAIKRGPATNVPLDFVISTGDNIDNNQENEMGWFVDLLDGDTVDPNSGGITYDGYTQAHTSQALSDEILALAQEPFDSVGTGVPWYAVLGNHDGLVQGNVPKTLQFNVVASGPNKAFVNIDTYDNCPDGPGDLDHLLAAFQDAYLNHSQRVPSDSNRSLMDFDNLIDQYFGDNTTTKPDGHGLKNAPKDPLHPDSDHAGYYTFAIGPKVQGVVMDTISHTGGPSGHIPNQQFEWIEKQLKKNSKRYYTADGERKRNRDAKNKMFVFFSHHSSGTLDNPASPEDDDPETPSPLPVHCFESTDQPQCADGEGLHSLMDRFPNVVLWVNGHEHNNRVRPFEAAEGSDPARAFWEINTAAHIDWPQQSRLIEIAWKAGKNGKPDTLFIYGTTVDQGAAPDPDEATQTPTDYLASISRVESYYDACVRPAQADCEAIGTPEDQNVKLVQKAPFNLGN